MYPFSLLATPPLILLVDKTTASVIQNTTTLPLLQVGAHPLEIKDRDHLVQLMHQGSASLPPMTAASSNDNTVNNGSGGIRLSSTTAGEDDDEDEGNGGGGAVPASRVGAGAAAKGRAGADLPPGFAAARAGDLEGLKKLVEGGDRWDPRIAVDRNGSSPLDWAAGEGRVEVCRWVGLGSNRRDAVCVVGLFVRLGWAFDFRAAVVVKWTATTGALKGAAVFFPRRYGCVTAGFRFVSEGLGGSFRLASTVVRQFIRFCGRWEGIDRRRACSGSRGLDSNVWLVENPGYARIRTIENL